MVLKMSSRQQRRLPFFLLSRHTMIYRSHEPPPHPLRVPLRVPLRIELGFPRPLGPQDLVAFRLAVKLPFSVGFAARAGVSAATFPILPAAPKIGLISEAFRTEDLPILSNLHKCTKPASKGRKRKRPTIVMCVK